MKKLQREDAVMDLDQVERKVQHLLEDVAKRLLGQVLFRERSHHGCAQLPWLHVVFRKPQPLVQERNAVREVQPLVWGQPLDHRLGKRPLDGWVREATKQHGRLGLKWWWCVGCGPCHGGP